MAGNEFARIRTPFWIGKIMSKLILITDIIEQKVRKEKELQYYQEELEKLKQKMWFIQKDIDVTNIIINMIETEKVVDLKEQMETKMLGEDDANS